MDGDWQALRRQVEEPSPGLMRLREGGWVERTDLDWEDVDNLPNDNYLYLDLVVNFRGEQIKTEGALRKRLELLLMIYPNEVKVERKGRDFRYTILVSKGDLLEMINNENYGVFPGDYTIMIQHIKLDNEDNEGPETGPELPSRSMVEADAARSPRELTIVIRKGDNVLDAPARGMTVFNLLSDETEVVRILEHFNLVGKILRVAKACPGIPTLEIELTVDLDELVDSGMINTNPMPLYEPTAQSAERLGHSPLFAHAKIDKGATAKRVQIEGVNGRVSLEHLRHLLSFQGEIVSDLEELTWKVDEGHSLSGVKNGDIVVFMKIHTDFSFVIIGDYAYKSMYAGNDNSQCSTCFSFKHRAVFCSKRDENRRVLLKDYEMKWKRTMNYVPLDDLITDNTINKDTVNCPAAILENYDEAYEETSMLTHVVSEATAPVASSLAHRVAEEERPPQVSSVAHRVDGRERQASQVSTVAHITKVADKEQEEEHGATERKGGAMVGTTVQEKEQGSEERDGGEKQGVELVNVDEGGGGLDERDMSNGNSGKAGSVDEWKTGEKRKASPKQSAYKKRLNNEEKEKALFATEINKLKIEASTKHLKPVTKDRILKSIDVVAEKYKQRIMSNSQGRNPETDLHLMQIRSEADAVKDFLNGMRSSK